jgi:hypothetical protein
MLEVFTLKDKRYLSNTISPIHQTINHFYYQDRNEPFIVGDCGIFTVRRLVNHIKISGHSSLPDLSTTSNQDLRNTMVDYMSARVHGNFEYLRRPCEYITQYALSYLMRALGVPEQFIRFTGIGEDDENAYEKVKVFKY